MVRAVLDTSVVVSAFRSRNGASFAVLELVAERRFAPLVSTALFLECEDVLQREDQRAVHGLSRAEVLVALRELAALCAPAETHFRWRPQTSDPGDDMVLEAAVNGRAEFLVTHNVLDFVGAAGKFQFRVTPPGAFLKRMRS